ncbi:hypothetical protein GJ496_000758 [Pomphorhynchus laevis]|nr:hypothetical protein GJ496_000758 [Pomphorhynchus laevis]
MLINVSYQLTVAFVKISEHRYFETEEKASSVAMELGTVASPPSESRKRKSKEMKKIAAERSGDDCDTDVSEDDSENGSKSTPSTKRTAVKKDSKAKKPAKASSEDENKFELSKTRFVSISEFRGNQYVDIREYYTDSNGELKPTKKGISLKPEQWKTLLNFADKINKKLK